MNIDEFRALKEGDRVRNAMTDSTGMVAEVVALRRGKIVVEVRWDGADVHGLFVFTEQSTAWMHWSVEAAS
jgi:hypothetical protein